MLVARGGCKVLLNLSIRNQKIVLKIKEKGKWLGLVVLVNGV